MTFILSEPKLLEPWHATRLLQLDVSGHALASYFVLRPPLASSCLSIFEIYCLTHLTHVLHERNSEFLQYFV